MPILMTVTFLHATTQLKNRITIVWKLANRRCVFWNLGDCSRVMVYSELIHLPDQRSDYRRRGISRKEPADVRLFVYVHNFASIGFGGFRRDHFRIGSEKISFASKQRQNRLHQMINSLSLRQESQCAAGCRRTCKMGRLIAGKN